MERALAAVLSLLVGAAATVALVRWGTARDPLPRSQALAFRLLGWAGLLALVALLWPAGGGSPNADPRALAFAALTVAVPVIPGLAAALAFDLGLLMYGDGRSYPAHAHVGLLLGSLLAYSMPLFLVGMVGFGSAVSEWSGPMRFEALGAAAFLVAGPFCFPAPIWLPITLVVLAIRSASASRRKP